MLSGAFFALRGPAKQLRSDCGTNFIGACKEMQRYLSEQGCSWEFNPPHSSHMGGSWERLIDIARRILDSMFLQLKTRLTHEVLSNRPPIRAYSVDNERGEHAGLCRNQMLKMAPKTTGCCTVPSCGKTTSLHCLPSDPNVRKEWMSFIFNEVSDHVSKNLVFCSLYFIVDSFTNKTQFDTECTFL